MSYEKRIPNWKELVEKASREHDTATAAASSLGIKIDTYRRYAKKYNCYKINQGAKGLSKPNRGIAKKIPLKEILEGKHPSYKTFKLKHRLYEGSIKKRQCEICNLANIWNGKNIEHHLDHINGNSRDHRLENLRILCPNCHSQTDSYCGKNKKL